VRIESFSARLAVAHDGHGPEEGFLEAGEVGRKAAAGQRRFSAKPRGYRPVFVKAAGLGRLRE
jgi:hypothetical protein